MIDTLAELFDLTPSTENDVLVLTARAKNASQSDKTLFSFVPPNSGMNIWVRLPLQSRVQAADSPPWC